MGGDFNQMPRFYRSDFICVHPLLLVFNFKFLTCLRKFPFGMVSLKWRTGEVALCGILKLRHSLKGFFEKVLFRFAQRIRVEEM